MAASSRKDDLFATLAVVILLIGTATGSAKAMIVMSSIALALMVVFNRKQLRIKKFRNGVLLVALAARLAFRMLARQASPPSEWGVHTMPPNVAQGSALKSITDGLLSGVADSSCQTPSLFFSLPRDRRGGGVSFLGGSDGSEAMDDDRPLGLEVGLLGRRARQGAMAR